MAQELCAAGQAGTSAQPCVLHSPETYALNVTALDRFGNPIDVLEESSDLGSPTLLRLQLRTAAGQCMLSPTSFVPAAPLNARCSEALLLAAREPRAAARGAQREEAAQ
jgi:hypothetical protein